MYFSLSVYLRGITLARVLKVIDILRKTSGTLVWGSHRPLQGVAKVRSSLANVETGLKFLTLKDLLENS